MKVETVCLSDMIDTLNKLKNAIEDINFKIEDIYKSLRVISNNDKKPNKCPVCEGSGGVKHPLTGLLIPAKCNSCEGKGIIWG